jgi:hypothetical protein
MEPGEAAMLALDKVSGKSARHEGDLDWVVDIRKGGGQDVWGSAGYIALWLYEVRRCGLAGGNSDQGAIYAKQFCCTTNAKIPSLFKYRDTNSDHEETICFDTRCLKPRIQPNMMGMIVLVLAK